MPLPNVLHGVRFARDGTGHKSETDFDSATVDDLKLSLDGATELRGGGKIMIEHHGYAS